MTMHLANGGQYFHAGRKPMVSQTYSMCSAFYIRCMYVHLFAFVISLNQMIQLAAACASFENPFWYDSVPTFLSTGNREQVTKCAFLH